MKSTVRRVRYSKIITRFLLVKLRSRIVSFFILNTLYIYVGNTEFLTVISIIMSEEEKIREKKIFYLIVNFDI